MDDSSALPLRSDDASGPSAAWPTTPPTSPVGTGTSAALRCWLQAQRRAEADGGIDPTEVRRTMRRFAEAGRQRGVAVERLIVLLKELWASLPPNADGDGRLSAHGVGSRAVLDGMIRVCIEEFYAPVHVGMVGLAPDRRMSGETTGGPATDGQTSGE